MMRRAPKTSSDVLAFAETETFDPFAEDLTQSPFTIANRLWLQVRYGNGENVLLTKTPNCQSLSFSQPARIPPASAPI